jgi:hypothetical protein
MAYIISHPDLKEITFNVVKDGFAARSLLDEDNRPIVVTVATADPIDTGVLPFVGINLMGDTETASHIGDSMADETVEVEGQVYAGASAIFSQQVEAKVWSTNAVERDTLGKMLKEILFSARGTSFNPGPFLTTEGLSLVKITGGHDEGISDTSEQYAPHPLYMRTYILSANTTLNIQEPTGAPITEVIPLGEAVNGNALAELEINPTTGEPLDPWE